MGFQIWEKVQNSEALRPLTKAALGIGWPASCLAPRASGGMCARRAATQAGGAVPMCSARAVEVPLREAATTRAGARCRGRGWGTLPGRSRVESGVTPGGRGAGQERCCWLPSGVPGQISFGLRVLKTFFCQILE
jgi:hypothetical protein